MNSLAVSKRIYLKNYQYPFVATKGNFECITITSEHSIEEFHAKLSRILRVPVSIMLECVSIKYLKNEQMMMDVTTDNWNYSMQDEQIQFICGMQMLVMQIYQTLFKKRKKKKKKKKETKKWQR
eukprot:252384_1